MITITKAKPIRWTCDALQYKVIYEYQDDDTEHEARVDWFKVRKPKTSGPFRGETRAPLILGTYTLKKEFDLLILRECGTEEPAGVLWPEDTTSSSTTRA